MSYGLRTKHFASADDVSVGTSATTICTLTPAGLFNVVVAEVESDALSDASLNAFKVQLQDHANGAWYDYVTSWSAPLPSGCSFVSGTPASLAADTKAHVHVRIDGAYGVRFVATVAADTALITIRGMLSCEAAGPAGIANELTAAPVEKSFIMGGAVVAAGPAPAPLAAASTFARKVVMTAVKATGAANTGVIYIGDANLIDTTAACIQLAPGDSFILEGSPGTKFDLNRLYLDGANVADGVRYLYQPV